MNITLVINSLASGGAERVLSGLANYWAAQGHQIHLITLADSSKDHYPLVAGITRASLRAGEVSANPLHALLLNWRRIRRLRKLLKQHRSDCVVAFLPTANVVSLLASLGTGVPVIVAERNHPQFTQLPDSRRWLQRKTFPRAYRVVTLSKDIAAWCAEHYNCRTTVIPNGIELPLPEFEPRIDPDSVVSAEHKLIISVGRLEPHKQMDHVVQAFDDAMLEPDWHLVIIGKPGPGSQTYAAELKNTSQQLANGARITFLERVGNMQAWYERAAIFMFASRYEGFPNVLLEAMACGCATISYDFPGVAAEVIQDEENGLLITDNNVDSLTAALQQVARDQNLQQRLAQAAPGVLETFSLQACQSRWTELVERAAGVDRPTIE
ncbi:MAG: glycosyltransferase [Pseudomonadota bacterium]